MSRKRDKEIADAIRNMHSLGDPVWRQAAIAHIKRDDGRIRAALRESQSSPRVLCPADIQSECAKEA